jgi:hypothetical protein
MSAIGGADLAKPAAGARHDLRHAERAADLDEFATRHRYLAAQGERVEHQQHGGRIVVDDGRLLGAGQLAQPMPHVAVALAASAGVQVVLQVRRAGHHLARDVDSLSRQRGAAEISMQHRAGEIEHRALRRPLRRDQALATQH